MIHNITRNVFYTDVREAANALNVTMKHVRKHLNGYYIHIHEQRLKFVAPYKERKKYTRRLDLRKPVRCIETGRKYVSQETAAAAYKVTSDVMSKHLKRIGRSHIKGVRFEWINPPRHHHDLFGPILNV